MELLVKIREKGLAGSLRALHNRLLVRPYLKIKHRKAPVFVGPTETELQSIEQDLSQLGIHCESVRLDPSGFSAFKQEFEFDQAYQDAQMASVADEKSLEHFVAYTFCDLAEFSPDELYVDVAASNSPWTQMLRDRGLNSYSIDLEPSERYGGLDYYLEANAKALPFESGSVRACSLQCAWEMFSGDDDWLFLKECKRVLAPGGAVVISPLYMHTHHCGYSTPDFYRRGYADAGAKEYIGYGLWGIPFSRKYSPEVLKTRIFDYATGLGLEAKLYKLENKQEMGHGIYLHFFLVIRQP